MNKEEAKKRQAELKSMAETCKDNIKYLSVKISKLEAIINKKDSWRSVRVSDSWEELYEEKTLLMADMMHFAYVRNEGWVPDWKDENRKWGLIADAVEGIYLYSYFGCNPFIFGIAVKSEEIVKEMLEEFGERIKKIYNKQY